MKVRTDEGPDIGYCQPSATVDNVCTKDTR